MGVTDRQTGRNLQIFSVGGKDYIGAVRECSVERTSENQENRALKDSTRFYEPVLKDWRIRFRLAVDGNPAVGLDIPSLLAKVGTEVALTVDLGAVTYSASKGLLTSSRHDAPLGLQETDFVILPRGVDMTVS
jgi:hypothetical protein